MKDTISQIQSRKKSMKSESFVRKQSEPTFQQVGDFLIEEILVRQRRLKPSIWKKKK